MISLRGTGNHWGMKALVPVVLMVVSAGCATNLSSLQTGKTLNPGQVRITGGYGGYIPVGQIVNNAANGIKLATKMADSNIRTGAYVLTPDDKETAAIGGIAMSMFPPSSIYEINGRVGIFRNFDAGFRFSGNSVRGDIKVRLHHAGDAEGWDEPRGRSYDVAIGLGVSKYMLNNPIEGPYGGFRLDEFNRWDFEVPVYFNADWNSHIGVYFVPKFLYSRTTLRQTLLSRPCECAEGSTGEVSAPGNIDMMFYGATLGLRFGGWRVTGMLELTVGNTESTPMLFGKKRNLGGATVQPNIGLAVSF